MVRAWHFLPDDRRLRWGTREVVEVGKPIKVEGKIELCSHGLHASIKTLDALNYAPGPIICRVELSGDIIKGNDKLVASERTVLSMADATETLRKFARMCALDVKHLWDMPACVLEYLETGNEDLRSAAESAAEYAARSTAEYAARYAAWSAAESTAEYAARYAAWSTARYAAESAAEYAAEVKQNRRLNRMLTSLLKEQL
jgi:hypothetical protein